MALRLSIVIVIIVLNILDNSTNKKHSQEPLNTIIELHGELEFKTKLFKVFHPRSATFAFSEQRITLTKNAECSGANYSLAERIFASKTEALQSIAIVIMLNTLDSSTNKKYLQEQSNTIIEVHGELEFKTKLFKVIHPRSPTLAFRIILTNNIECSGANYSLIERIFACKSDVLRNQTTRSNFSGLKNLYSFYYDVCDYAFVVGQYNLRYYHRKPKRSKGRCLLYPNSCATQQLLLRGGNICTNPGPSSKQPTRKCEQCEKTIRKNQKCVTCNVCVGMNHVKYAGLKHVIHGLDWTCGGCVLSILAFSACSSEEIVGDHELAEPSEDEETTQTIIRILREKSKDLRLMHLNTQCMTSTFNEFLLTVKQYPMDIIHSARHGSRITLHFWSMCLCLVIQQSLGIGSLLKLVALEHTSMSQ